jgi:hypothetical protein
MKRSLLFWKTSMPIISGLLALLPCLKSNVLIFARRLEKNKEVMLYGVDAVFVLVGRL